MDSIVKMSRSNLHAVEKPATPERDVSSVNGASKHDCGGVNIVVRGRTMASRAISNGGGVGAGCSILGR